MRSVIQHFLFILIYIYLMYRITCHGQKYIFFPSTSTVSENQLLVSCTATSDSIACRILPCVRFYCVFGFTWLDGLFYRENQIRQILSLKLRCVIL